jgi:hypothetical protein
MKLFNAPVNLVSANSQATAIVMTLCKQGRDLYINHKNQRHFVKQAAKDEQI